MTAHAPKACLRGLACTLAALSGPAGAVGLGELQVHSSIGEALDVTVTLSTAPEERLRPECFSLGRVRAGDLPAVGRATFAVEPEGGGWRLRIRTRAVVSEPAVMLRLNAACENKAASSRDYEILLDPRPDPGPPPAFRSLAGDTLASLATAIYPRSRAVRDAYVQALRAANPAIAGLGSDEAIPAGTEVVLPDLKRFSLSLAVTPPAPRAAPPAAARREHAAPPRAAAPAEAKAPEVKVPEPKPAPARPPAVPKPPPPALTAPDTAKAPVAPAPARPAPARKEGAFVLRLSSPAMDLDRSRGIDEGKRAVLRERLLILDADDQVSALLAMRNSLKQLEGRVAELQLKLSALPPTAPAPARAPAPVASAPATPAPKPLPQPVASPPAPAPVPAPAASATVPPPTAVKPAPAASAKPETSASAPEPKPPVVAAPTERKPTAPAAKSAARGPSASPPPEAASMAWLWIALALVVAAVAAGAAWWALRRRRTKKPVVAAAPQASALDEAAVLMQGAAAKEPPSAGHRVVADSDASLATHIPGADPTALRRRYIEERFPEISGGTIAPGDADSVVKAARLFYEDGAIARAIELLQFTVEENPAAMKPWLALFEIFRLEHLTGEFSELARRFREHHGATENWRKVQYIGCEIDAQNPLYRDAGFNSLETIGYPAAKKEAPVTFDPLAENWLNAPMDFTTDALAASLRTGLLADAGVGDADLAADPMPALKNVEVFNVA